jgi:D-aspartate ligase
MNTRTAIVVLGLRRGRFHHGVLGIARSAGRLGVPVHRFGRERQAPAAASRYISSWNAIDETLGNDEVLEILRTLTRAVGRSVLIPVDDAASGFVDDHLDALEPDFLLPRQPAGLARSLASKQGMFELCQRHAIPTPRSFFPRSEGDVREFVERASFPIVMKCIDAAAAPSAAPSVLIAQDREEVARGYRLMGTPDAGNVMLQEYIPGTPEHVWMFNGYFDESSTCKVGFTGRKIRQAPPYTGATTLGECLANPTVHDTTVRFMRELGYRGILDIGYRFDARDGEYKLLDVNPRIGATFRLFVSDDGTDVLRALYLDLTGQEVPTTTVPRGRRWVVEPLDLKSTIAYRRRGDITLGRWLRSFRGVREAAWFARDDLRPFLVLWLRLVTDQLSGRLRRL